MNVGCLCDIIRTSLGDAKVPPCCLSCHDDQDLGYSGMSELEHDDDYGTVCCRVNGAVVPHHISQIPIWIAEAKR